MQCQFFGNTVSKDEAGGAIHSKDAALLNISACTFSCNEVGRGHGGRGGGVSASNTAVIAVSDSTFTQNRADTKGGAVWIAVSDRMLLSAQASLSGCTFINNSVIQSRDWVISGDGGKLLNLGIHS